MKQIRKIMMLAVAAVFATSAQAQVEDFGVFRHIGADINVGTQGIGFDIATPVTNYLELSLGMNFMPGFKISGDVDIDPSLPAGAPAFPSNANMDIEGKLSRTTGEFKVSVYPFGVKNALFVAGGLSFGGKKIAKLNGHSDAVESYLSQYPQYRSQITAELDKYELEFDDNGNITGDVRVKAVRPYLALGYGRLVPKHRLGFRVELGCQFMGKMKVYQNDSELSESLMEKADDDLSDFIDKFKVYPVLKFSLTGRIL